MLLYPVLSQVDKNITWIGTTPIPYSLSVIMSKTLFIGKKHSSLRKTLKTYDNYNFTTPDDLIFDCMDDYDNILVEVETTDADLFAAKYSSIINNPKFKGKITFIKTFEFDFECTREDYLKKLGSIYSFYDYYDSKDEYKRILTSDENKKSIDVSNKMSEESEIPRMNLEKAINLKSSIVAMVIFKKFRYDIITNWMEVRGMIASIIASTSLLCVSCFTVVSSCLYLVPIFAILTPSSIILMIMGWGLMKNKRNLLSYRFLYNLDGSDNSDKPWNMIGKRLFMCSFVVFVLVVLIAIFRLILIYCM